jgi:RNA polymerase-interacting CarD/CdnL/TRCF family regulator
MKAKTFQPGDHVLHPLFGFGVIQDVMTRESEGQSTDYYNILLTGNGLLSLPVAQAKALGLRRAVNGLAALIACLHSPADPLPDDARLRAIELNTRLRAPQPKALMETVRDLLDRGLTRNLTPADKKWLLGAQERLSVEVAIVDRTASDEARAAIQREIEAFTQRKPAPA